MSHLWAFMVIRVASQTKDFRKQPVYFREQPIYFHLKMPVHIGVNR